MARTDGTEASGGEGGSGGGGGGIASINPSEIDAAAAGADPSSISARTGKPKRAYTRREGGKETSTVLPERKPEKAKGTPLSVNAIQFSLSGIHALLAAGLSAPELELNEVEARTISENVVAVSKHFDVQQSAKATDIGNLVVSLGIVYGGKMIAITKRNKREAVARRAAGAPVGVVLNGPSTVRVEHPPVAGKPAGAMPLTRPKTEADQALLNEIEPFMA